MDEKKKNIIELLNYVVVGGLTTLVNLKVYFFLYTYTTALFNSKCYSMDICSAVRLYSE